MTNAATELNVVRQEDKPCHLRLDIEVPLEIVQDSFQRALELFRTKAKVPGFRPGKTPDRLIRKRFRNEIMQEAKRILIEDNTRRACEQEKVAPETTPRVENADDLTVSENESFVFAVSFDVAPDFELPEYKNLTVTTKPGAVHDKEVDEAIDQWLQQRVSYKSVERAAVQGDLLKVTYHGTVRDAEVEIPETAKLFMDAEETWFPLRDPEILPGAAAALVGAEPGSKHEVAVTFPDGFAEERLAGKTVDYKFDVLEVHAAEVPELDQVAAEMGAENAAQVRGRIMQRMTLDRQRQKDDDVRRQVARVLMEQVDFPLPPNLLGRDTYQAFARLYEEEMRQGKNENDLKAEQSELMQRASELAKQQLKRYYIFSRIADAEKIQVESADLEQTLTSLAQYHRVKPEVLQRRLQESGRLTDLLMSIRETKAVNFVVSEADVVETEGQEE